MVEQSWSRNPFPCIQTTLRTAFHRESLLWNTKLSQGLWNLWHLEKHPWERTAKLIGLADTF